MAGFDADAVIRAIAPTLITADSPNEIESVVRDELTTPDRYPFAWIGEFDEAEGCVIPWIVGSKRDWPADQLFEVDFTVEPATLVERALVEESVAVRNDLFSRGVSAPFGAEARDRGFGSVAVVPLAEGGEHHGVLVVYAEETGHFEPTTIDALGRVGSVVTRALHQIVLQGQVDQLELTLSRYERLVETLGDGVYVLDREGNFTTVNTTLAEMSGYGINELLGEHISVMMAEEDVDRGQRTIRRLLEDDDIEEDTFEMELITRTGDRVPTETHVALLLEDGEFQGTVGVMRDITERVEREEELRRQNDRLEAFAEIVSHDLRNPLGVAKGYLDLARETGESDPLEEVEYSLDRMEDIIMDVLTIARQGQAIEETGPQDLHDIVEEAWGNVSSPDANLALEGNLSFQANRSRMLRMLENMFRNAMEHAGDDVTVTVGRFTAPAVASPAAGEEGRLPEDLDGDDAVTGFYVEDDGEGIPEAQRGEIFSSSFSTGGDGLGIGLWVVKEVVDAHGWTIEATASEDGGARFEVLHVDDPLPVK